MYLLAASAVSYPSIFRNGWESLANRPMWTNSLVLCTFPELRDLCSFFPRLLPATPVSSQWDQPYSIPAWDPAVSPSWAGFVGGAVVLYFLCCALNRKGSRPLLPSGETAYQSSQPAHRDGDGAAERQCHHCCHVSNTPSIRGSWWIAKESGNFINHFSHVEQL